MSIAVIGGGPAGMMAAYAAAINGGKVTLFERNEKLGKKLFLAGKGRCNFTNARPIDEFFDQIPRNAKFLYSALYTFTNQDLIDLLQQHGLPTKVERGGRVFPASDKSSDVIKTLRKMLKQSGVAVKLDANVQEIIIEKECATGIVVDGRRFFYDAVILATGGLSYPSTGSNGDGYAMAVRAGHNKTETKASLIPLVAKGQSATICKSLTGLSLKNVEVTLLEGKKIVFSERGEMLFTHFGVSGPLVLSASAHITDYTFSNTVIQVDFKPALDKETLEARLLREFEAGQNKQLKTVLQRLLPKAICTPVLQQAASDEEVYVHSLTKPERLALVQTLKAFQIEIGGTRSIDEAIITRGGIQVKHIKNLYLCGEMVDIDAYTGGYNLQIAFSTGYLAGQSSAISLIDK